MQRVKRSVELRHGGALNGALAHGNHIEEHHALVMRPRSPRRRRGMPAELALAEEGALDGTIAAAIAGHEVIARVTLCRAG
jgi:hypothetical protein